MTRPGTVRRGVVIVALAFAGFAVAVAEVDADVAEAGEEEEVAGSERAARDAAAVAKLRCAVVRQRNADVAVDPLRQAGAVDPAPRRVAAPAVRDADGAPGEHDDLVTAALGPQKLQAVGAPAQDQVR